MGLREDVSLIAQNTRLLATRIGEVVKQRGVPTGGTTGQVLTKTGSADYAASWQTPITFVPLTQAQYDALSTADKNDPSKVYVVS